MRMNREKKLKKLTKLFMQIFGVSELPSVSELNLYLEKATEDQITGLFFALYEANFMSMSESLHAFKIGEKIEKIKEVYFKISKPEGSA